LSGGLLLLLALSIVPGFAATSVTQYGITWYFSANRTVGQFANDDYWVLGPVTIDSITPHKYRDTTGLHHGWEVNPRCNGGHGFDQRLAGFDSTRIPSLPYSATGTVSIIKTVSGSTCCYPGLKTAAVLTVVESVPPDSGRTVLRPPYVGTAKPYYSVSSFRTDLLPSYAPVTVTPTLAGLYASEKYVRMDHIPGNSMLYRPADNLPDYAADINQQNADAILRLCLNDPLIDKMPLLTVMVQGGTDYLHFVKNGHRFPPSGGEQPGNVLPMLFAAIMLDNQEFKDTLRAMEPLTTYYNKIYYEKWTLGQRGKENRVLWGHHEPHNPVENYWQAIITGGNSGSKTIADPYGYIDGGYKPGDIYQLCCTSQPFKSTALCLHLIPALKTVWDPDYLYEYTDRWVNFGAWTQPDPCAPVIAGGTYKVDFGPDTTKPGDCIRDRDSSDGIGRFPLLHGTNKDGGNRKSNFVAALWNAYRNTVPVTGQDTHPSLPYMNGVWPNPASMELMVPSAKGSVLFYTLQGALVQECAVHKSRVDIRAAQLPSGIYWMTGEGLVGARKVVIINKIKARH
jgi:hypothetical protein